MIMIVSEAYQKYFHSNSFNEKLIQSFELYEK